MRCERCDCTLDFGNTSERMDEPTCVLCDLILGGMEPIKATHEAYRIKRERLSTRHIMRDQPTDAPY